MTTPKANLVGLALIAALCAGFTLGLTAPAWAGFDEGVAAYELGDYETAIRELRPLAEQGHAKAQFILGNMYGEEGGRVPRDDAKALQWYRKAAEGGYVKAQNFLGVMYGFGLLVPQDFAKAAKWLRKAAEQGDADAQKILGSMYEKGQGVPQDYARAHMWYNLAASRYPPGKDRDRAVKIRDIVAERMTPDQISEAEKLAREWRPKK